MSPFAANVSTCHRCNRHDGSGGCREGGTIEAAATAGVCPLGRFPARDSTSRGPSFTLDDDPNAVDLERRRLQAGGCCGAPSVT